MSSESQEDSGLGWPPEGGPEAEPGSGGPEVRVAGARWSVVERFERGGQLYLVAVRPASGWKALTRREAEVLALVRDGHTNKVIAFELGVAWSTVRVLVQRAAHKFGVRTRAELERRLRDVA